MARVIDTLREKMNAISEKPELILNEQFMIDIFKEYREELPPFQAYWDEMFNKKQMSVVARRSGSKVMQLAEVKKSLFKPSRKTDKQAKKRLLLLAPIATRTIVKEIDDPKKATYKYTKASKSKRLWEQCPEQKKLDFLGCKATNDEAESTLGGATHQMQRYGRINLAAAGAISSSRQNSFSYRPTSNKDKKSKSMFRSFDKVLRAAIIKVGIKDAPRTRTVNNEAVELQQKFKQAKEDINR